MKKLLIISAMLLVFFCSSSKTVIDEPLIKNPTFYTFSKSKQEVEKAIVEALGGSNSSKKSKFYKYILNEYPNGNFKLMTIDGNPSKVYFRKNGEAYIYRPSIIQILIDSVNENATKISINIVEPAVRVGLTLLPKLPHLQRVWKYKAVHATTVEEYEILLMIGEELEAENMPELKIPLQITP